MARVRRYEPLIVAALVLVGLLACASFPTRSDALTWLAPILVLGFIAAESFSLHIQIGRVAHSLSLGDLPLVLGLVFASSWDVLVGGVVACVLLATWWRQPFSKVVINGALRFATAGVAVSVFDAVSGTVPGASGGVRGWLAVFLAVAVAGMLEAFAVLALIAVHTGRIHLEKVLAIVALYLPVTTVITSFGLVAEHAIRADGRAAVLVGVCIGAFAIAYRAYARLGDRHADLERLYRASRHISATQAPIDVIGTVLDESRQLLGAEYAELVVSGTVGEPDIRYVLDPAGRAQPVPGADTARDFWRREVEDSAVPLLIPRDTKDPAYREGLAADGCRELLIAPLVTERGAVGSLVLVDRMGEVRAFDDADLRLLETVANHAGTALSNGWLLDRLRHEALHDALTELANRPMVELRLAELVHGPGPERCAVLLLDLDGFKHINDTLGHETGDVLLREVATRLVAVAGPGITVARLGGDEFALVVPGPDAGDAARAVGESILASLTEPVHLTGINVVVRASIGVALAVNEATPASTLLRRADVAMYAAKGSGGGLQFYRDELDGTSRRQLLLAGDLRAALTERQLEVHVQPKADLETGTPVGVEALVRWRHPELGMIPPDEFISLAEGGGLIGELTRFVLDETLAAAVQWYEAGLRLGVAVNVSPRGLFDDDLVGDVRTLLERHPVPAGFLTLEITEGIVLHDRERAVEVLQTLREMGVRISVDDFGTGYSSLSYLRSLPIDELKIDRTFITGLVGSVEDRAIVRAILALAESLRLTVVAEGIEDQPTWDELVDLGCDVAQGYFLCRPVPIADLAPWAHARMTPARQVTVAV